MGCREAAGDESSEWGGRAGLAQLGRMGKARGVNGTKRHRKPPKDNPCLTPWEPPTRNRLLTGSWKRFLWHMPIQAGGDPGVSLWGWGRTRPGLWWLSKTSSMLEP